jgi:hypothetical protein
MPTTVDVRPHKNTLDLGKTSPIRLGPPTGAGQAMSAGATSSRNTTAFPAGTDYVVCHNRGNTLVFAEVGVADSVAAVAGTSTPLPVGQLVILQASPGQKVALIEVA